MMAPTACIYNVADDERYNDDTTTAGINQTNKWLHDLAVMELIVHNLLCLIMLYMLFYAILFLIICKIIMTTTITITMMTQMVITT